MPESVRVDLAGQPTVNWEERDSRFDVGGQFQLFGPMLEILRVLIARRYSRGLDVVYPVFVAAVASDVPKPAVRESITISTM